MYNIVKSFLKWNVGRMNIIIYEQMYCVSIGCIIDYSTLVDPCTEVRTAFELLYDYKSLKHPL